MLNMRLLVTVLMAVQKRSTLSVGTSDHESAQRFDDKAVFRKADMMSSELVGTTTVENKLLQMAKQGIERSI
jgi:hypothetical protein